MLKQTGLEYSVPARGGWTIVHVGMLVPEAHEIFVCAAGCLRGVVISAAEMNLTDRFSTVAIEEHNVTDGDMEELLVEGVSDIIRRLKKKPPCVLVYTSCIHHFMGTDLDDCFKTLSERFKDIDFVDCYMTPTMRKGALNPDKMMRKRLYAAIRPLKTDPGKVLMCGNCFSLTAGSDIRVLVKKAGKTLLELPEIRTYAEYKRLGECGTILTDLSVAKPAGEELAAKLGVKHVHLSFSFGYESIKKELSVLAAALGTTYDSFDSDSRRADEALADALGTIGNHPVAIDSMITTAPYSLARLLCEHGFNVSVIYADSSAGEEEDLMWIMTNRPQILHEKCVSPFMRTYKYSGSEKLLALGQKAAYFTETPFFVDMVENGPLFGFDGIVTLARLMKEAFLNEKDLKKTLDIKGWGCESCI